MNTVGFFTPSSNPEAPTLEAQLAMALSQREQGSSTGSLGGYLVSRGTAVRFWNEVLDDALLSLVTAITVQRDDQLPFTIENTSSTATWRVENTAVPVADALFSTTGPLELHSLATGSASSAEWWQDARVEAFQELVQVEEVVDAEGVVDILHTRRIRRTLNDAIINGSGTNQPTGILNDSGTSTTTGTITQANLETVYTSLADRYINEATWVMAPATWVAVRGITAVASSYREEKYLIERPVLLNEYVPANTVIFGRWANYCLLRSEAIVAATDTESGALAGRVLRFTLTRATGKALLGVGGDTAFSALVPAAV